MNGTIDDAYLTWLYGHIGSVNAKNPSRTHWKLARQLYKKEFIWLIPNDDNRVADGRALRSSFIEECEIEDVPPEWLDLGCSLLEMLIALSFRLSFITGEDPRNWFWQMIENTGIGMEVSADRHYTDELYLKIDGIINRVIWRTYSKTGEGGLFPLPDTDKDQRKIEIWYQMSAYLIDDF